MTEITGHFDQQWFSSFGKTPLRKISGTLHIALHIVSLFSLSKVLNQLSLDCQSEERAAAVKRLAGLNC